jgi:hypothetical protein
LAIRPRVALSIGDSQTLRPTILLVELRTLKSWRPASRAAHNCQKFALVRQLSGFLLIANSAVVSVIGLTLTHIKIYRRALHTSMMACRMLPAPLLACGYDWIGDTTHT